MSYDAFGSGGGNNGSYEGFSSSQQGGGNFASPSQGTMKQYGAAADGGSGGGKKFQRDTQSLVPLTIKMILDAVDEQGNGKFFIDGRQVQQVSLVVNVLNVTTKETHADILVEDGTGQTNVKLFTDNDEAPPVIPEGAYAMVVGQIKRMGGSTVVSAFTVNPLPMSEDSNHLIKHYLDVILTSKRARFGPIKEGMNGAQGQAAAAFGGARPASSAAAAAAGGQQQQQMKFEQGINGGQQYQQQQQQPQQNGGYGMSDMPAGLPSTGDPIRDQVLAAFATGPDANTDGGCSTQSVAQHLSHLSFIQVQEAIAGLSNDGHLYSTVDEEHYKTTSS